MRGRYMCGTVYVERNTHRKVEWELSLLSELCCGFVKAICQSSGLSSYEEIFKKRKVVCPYLNLHGLDL